MLIICCYQQEQTETDTYICVCVCLDTVSKIVYLLYILMGSKMDIMNV